MNLRDVPGLGVGHATNERAVTGCSVVLAAAGAVAGVDVRGSAPGTRETDLLRPTALVERIHAVCLAGGSAFGLAAADGVMRYLAERRIGFETGIRPVPIVPAAVIFDLAEGDADAYPGPDDGYAACAAAAAGEGPVEGRVGAGRGATIDKLAGARRARPGGVGSWAMPLPGGGTVAALVVNNAAGNVGGRGGAVAAATPGGGADPLATPGSNTVLVVVGTDVALDRAECQRLATLAHDGVALAVSPAHTLLDGDVAFVLSTALAPAPAGRAERLALETAVVEVVRVAIGRSVADNEVA